MTMDKVYHQNRSSGFTSTVTLNRPNNTNGLNGSVNCLVSRLPQRRESKIPGPNNQSNSPGIGCNFNGISSSSSSPSSYHPSTTTTTCSSNFTPTIGPSKKFLNPPNKLLSTQGTGLSLNRNDSSLRSVSPTTVYKCKSTQSHLIVPSPSVTTTGSTTVSSLHSPSMCNTNSSVQSNQNNSNCNDANRGIRPPRLTSMTSNMLPVNGSPTPTGKSLVTVNRSQITRHSMVNNGFATVGRSGSSLIQNHHRSLTLREVKEDEAPRRSKTPSCSGPVRGVPNMNGNNNNSPRPTAGNLTSTLNANRSDSTPSLTENESGPERKTIIGNNKNLTRTNLTKGLVGGAHGIPLPKSRPNSVCLDNSPVAGSTVITSSSSTATVSHKTPSMSSVNGASLSKGINKSGLRPLSSSGIPKTGLSGHRSSILSSKMNEESPKSENIVERGRRPTVESHLVPTRSEPNVARVSPIRRSIGQNVNGDNGSGRSGIGPKEEESNHHHPHLQQPKQHPQYDDKMDDEVNYSSSGLTGCSVSSSTVPSSSSSSNVTSSVMVPTSAYPPTPLSPISSSLSSLSSVSSPSTSIITSSSSTATVTTPTSFNSKLIHQLPLGLSSASRASEPMLPNLSSPSSNQQNSSLKSVVEENQPIKARSTLSLSSHVNQLDESKDDYPTIKKIDLSANVLSFLESTRSISSSCDLINSNCTVNGENRSLNSTLPQQSKINFSSNSSESSPIHSNGYMSPVLEDESSPTPSRQSIDSPIESPFNQTIIDRTKSFSLNHNSQSINGNSSSLSNFHDSNFNEKIESTINNNNSLANLNSTISVPSTNNNLLNKINRCIKCTLPSEAELGFKTDLRLTSNHKDNGLTGGCGSIIELTSYGANGCGNLISPTTPPPLSANLQSSSSPQLPPPPLLLQSNGLASNSLTNQIKRLSKNGELRGSTISLLSGSSSFSATEERHNQEVKKLRDDLNRANNKVETLTQQLKNSNDMTQTFGKILETLRSRLYQCSLATDQKDREIGRLKTTIEVLRRECANGDLNGVGGKGNPSCYGSSSDIECRRDKNKKRSNKEPRSPSCDRDTINSGDSSGPSGWFKGSIQRAFKKNRSRNKSGGSMSDVEATINTKLNHGSDSSSSLPSTPLALNNKFNNKTDPFVELNLINNTNGTTNHINTNGSADLIIKDEDGLIKDLKKQLRDKEKQLNDIRLEVLLTASQMESLNDRISKMSKEMSQLRSENHRLQCLLLRQSSIG
ncbi:neuron navigator 2-like [Panonychus citri]|uniref:neuron navigator 2-like n=1 Tax=Panonychus citri TaxID=50023 RepID=UPI00230779A6|nr:neuron navigator 2-like [Panonychus citri]